jgi:ABC-2 type transport system ATP-binding protein
MEEAEVCDKIAIIDNGKIVAEGSPDELKKIVGGDVVSLRTTDNKWSKQEIKKLFDIDAEEKDGELYLTTSKGDACIPELIRGLGDIVLSVKLQRPTINDVFLKLTGKAIRDEDSSGMSNIKEEVRAYRRRH